jgi:hypothetical protein
VAGGLRSAPLVRAVVELDARERAGKLAAARDPGDGGALVEEVHRVNLAVLLLDHAHTKDLAFLLVREELGGEDLRRTITYLRLCFPKSSSPGQRLSTRTTTSKPS